MPPKRRVSPLKSQLPVTVVEDSSDEELITSWPAFRAYYAETYGKAPTETVSEAWKEYKEINGIETKGSPRKRGARKVSPVKETPAKVKSPINKVKSPLKKKKPLPLPPNKYVANLIVVGTERTTRATTESYASLKSVIGGKLIQKRLDIGLENYLNDIKSGLDNNGYKYQVTNDSLDSPVFVITKKNKDDSDYEVEQDLSIILQNAGSNVTIGEYNIDYFLQVGRNRRSKERAYNILYLGNGGVAENPKEVVAPQPPQKKKSTEIIKVSATKATLAQKKSNSNIKKVEVFFMIYKNKERLTNPSKSDISAIEQRLSDTANTTAIGEDANVPILDYSEKEQTVSVFKDSARVTFSQDRTYSISDAVSLVDDYANNVIGEGPIKVGKDKIELFLDSDATKEFNTFALNIQADKSPYGQKKVTSNRPGEIALPRGNSIQKQKTPLAPIDRKSEVRTSITISGTFGVAEAGNDGQLVPLSSPMKAKERGAITETLKEIAEKKGIVLSTYGSTFTADTVTIFTVAETKSNRVGTIKYLEDLVIGVPIDIGNKVLYLY